jgi:hypothetical protein
MSRVTFLKVLMLIIVKNATKRFASTFTVLEVVVVISFPVNFFHCLGLV